jgi:predicted RNase H-like HicB family nuclease
MKVPRKAKYTAVVRKCGRWYTAWIEEVPGVNTQGRTLTEVRRNLKDALRGILEINRELSEKKGKHRGHMR